MAEQLNTIPAETAMPLATLALRSRVDELYSPEYFGGLSQLAGAAAKSRLFGDLTPDQLFIILMTGREMGLPPTVALRNIGSFKGKTVISSQLQMAKVKESGYIVKILENTAERATVSVQRKGEDAYVKTFTLADATLAGLLNRNELYKTNPATMLLNRAIGLACRYGAPEVLNGLHNADELVELDEPTDSDTASINTESQKDTTNGWNPDTLSEFEIIMDRAYKAFKLAGVPDDYNTFREKWKANQSKDPAELVLTKLADFVDKMEVAAKAKAEAAEKAA